MDMLQSFLPPPAEPVSDAPEDGLADAEEVDEPPQAAPAKPRQAAGPIHDNDFEEPW